MNKIGFIGIARETFDLALAAQTARLAHKRLRELGFVVIGDDSPLTDAASTQAAARRVLAAGAESLLIAQLTFTDADAVRTIAAQTSAPLLLWAFPEARSGGRLRLNSPCGVNLATHALGKGGRVFAPIYCAPDELTAPMLRDAGAEAKGFADAEDSPPPIIDEAVRAKVRRVLASLDGTLLARIGLPPTGFATCDFSAEFLRRVFGITVRDMDLAELFTAAAEVAPATVKKLRDAESAALADFDKMDKVATDKTLRLRAALRQKADMENWIGAAVRCWPEMFTEYGGAGCGAMSALSGEGVPCACEADVYGALTARLLEEFANTPAFLADWVDCAADGTAAFWHCGLAPLQMAGDAPRATIHSNRKMPLLREFSLKPGTVTVMRLTMARNRPRIAAARAEMITAPRPFGGTCGVLRFAHPASAIFERVLRAGIEHHFAIVYGDVFAECAALAQECGLAFFPLCVED
ncbi:MAG: L-fucose/L-arabinose isomerase family protein [Gammaproteobacteria bacterium]